MPRIFLPFAEWLPDIPPLENPGALVATNVIPGPNNYLPFPSPVVFSTSLGGVCKGGIVARDAANNVYNYAGDASALYQLVGTSWTNVARLSGGAYATPTDDFWEFIQWGQTVIGVNGANADVPQAISLGAANFTALSGSPPRARHIAVVRDFVVLGNISATAALPQTVQWCAINNANSWTADAATLADRQDLPGDGGWVQKIIGGEYGVILQERAIFRMTFIGSPLIFQFDQIHNNIGAYAPQSVVAYQNKVFFLAEDGFYYFDGQNVNPIGRGKVDSTFFADLDTTYYYRIQGAIDPINKLTLWAYPAAGNTGGNPNKILVYSWAFNRWSLIEGIDVEYIMRTLTGTYTLESLDNISGSIDALTDSLDSRVWNIGQLILSGFNSSHRLTKFVGSAMAATIDTGELCLNKAQQGRSCITEIRPNVEGYSASAQIAIISRNVLTQSASVGAASSPNGTGFVTARNSARYHRIRLTTTSATDFDHLQGVEVTFNPEGDR